VLPSLQVGGSDIEYVDSWTHLGHVLSSDFRDNMDIEHRRVQTVKQINDLLSYFGKLDAIVKLQLLYSYCSSLYGSELWDLSCSAIDVLCVSWRRALKNVWKLPLNTHGNVIYALSCVRPIEVELKCRVLNFVLKCLNSNVDLVRSVTRHVISLLGCQSPIGKNYVSCCQFFSLPATVPDEYCTLGYNQILVKASDWTRFVKAPISTITQLFELIVIRDGVYKQFSVIDDGNLLTIDEVKSIIYFICTS